MSSEEQQNSIVEPSQQEDSSVKDRATLLWSSLRSSVSNTSREIKDTLYKTTDHISCFSKPICLQGQHCKQASDREHMRLFRHLCPYGMNCTSQSYTAHVNDFVHSTVMAEEAILVDPDDNRMKATTNTTSSSEKKSNEGILDFLDDSKNDNVKTLKHMVNFGGANSNSNNSSTLGSSDRFERNAPVNALVPIRVSYGLQQWNIYFYPQTAQWPQPGEMLTEDEQIFLNTFNRRHLNHDNNSNDDDRYKGTGSTPAPNAEEKDLTDKAKDFFTSLFTSVKSTSKTTTGVEGQSSSSEQQHENNNQTQHHEGGNHKLATSEEEGVTLLSNEDTAM